MPYREAANNSTGSLCLRRVGLPSSLPIIGNVFSLNNGTTVIGRNPFTSDIFLDSAVHKALISRLHARITTDCNESKVTICDTSLNGTYVNDKKILDTEEIKVGDTITFGHLKGAVLEPGVIAKQWSSEFMFKLEKCAPKTTHQTKESVPPKYPYYGNNTTVSDPSVMSGFLPDLSPFLNSTEEDSFGSQNIERQETPKPILLDSDEISLPKETAGTINLTLVQDSEDDDDDISIIDTFKNKDNSVLQPRNAIVKPGHMDNATNYIDLEKDNSYVRDPKIVIEITDDKTVEINKYTKVKMFSTGNAKSTCNNDQLLVSSREAEELGKANNGDPNRLVDFNKLKDANKLQDAFELGDSECDNDELLAFAVAAGDCMDDDLSDSELFSVDISSFPKTVESLSSQLNNKSPCRASFLLRDGTSNRGKLPLAIDACSTSENQSKTLKRPKKGRSKKKKYLKASARYEKNFPDTCGFKSDCLRPHDREELVEWVQCDYCRRWYHLECTGLTLDKVNNTAVKFNCGCVYTA